MERQAIAKLTSERWGPAEPGPPQQLVVLCHGMGGKGSGVLNRARILSKYLPHAIFIAPNGPEAAGGEGRRWFPAKDLDPAVLEPALRRAAAALDGFIDEALAEHHLPPDQYALFGVSQGAMTVLFAGPRRAIGPKAIFAFAGALVSENALAAEIKNRPPIFLGHGEMDQVVPSFCSVDAANTLRANGMIVETLYPPDLGHQADDKMIHEAGKFMRRAFAGELVPAAT